jgi:hypothetical protein
MTYSGPEEAWQLSLKLRMKQERGRFSGFARLVLGGASLSEGPVIVLGGRPGNRSFFQKIGYVRCDLVHDLRDPIKTVGQQKVQIGQQPREKSVDLDRGLKSTQRSDGMTESLIPAWWGDVVAPEAFNDVADV